MNDIRRLLRTAGRRLLLIDLIGALALALAIVTGVLIVVLLADRLAALGLPWAQISLWALGAGVVGAVIWTVARRAREHTIARILDERAQLRETLSTALCVEKATDPWSQAVVETAKARAARVVVRDALPIEGPRFWQIPAGMLMAFAVLWFLMPTMDLLGKQRERQAQIENEREILEARNEAIAALEKAEAILSRSNIELGTIDADGLKLDQRELDDTLSPAEVRTVAMRKLTNLTDQLNDRLNAQEAKTLQSLESMMRQMRTPGQGPMTEMSRDMARGDFRSAKAKLAELSDKLRDGKMTPQEQQEFAEQLKNVAKQLEQLAQQRSELEQSLRQAGMSAEQAAQAAADPEQLKQALEQMQNLSPEQKEQLQQQAQAAQQASQQAQAMSEAMQNLAQCMNPGASQGDQGSQQMQQAMQQLASQLGQMEMMQQDMQATQAAMQAAMQQLGQLGQGAGEQSWAQCQGGGMSMAQGGNLGQWAQGDSANQGSGSGGPGQGFGDSPQEEGADYVIKAERTQVQNVGGPIIGTTLVYGDQVRGESVMEFASVVATASQQATSEALEEQLVPREFHESVKAYFGRLERRAAQAQQNRQAQPPANPD